MYKRQTQAHGYSGNGAGCGTQLQRGDRDCREIDRAHGVRPVSYTHLDVYKRQIKTLILTLWKRDDEAPKRSEEVALSNAVSAYIERITGDRSVTVSYTHLDVYKRQLLEHGGRAGENRPLHRL